MYQIGEIISCQYTDAPVEEEFQHDSGTEVYIHDVNSKQLLAKLRVTSSTENEVTGIIFEVCNNGKPRTPKTGTYTQ